VLLFGPQRGDEVERDAVEPAVDAGGVLAALDAAGAVEGPGVQQVDVDLPQRAPQPAVAPGGEDRLAGAGDDRAGVIQQPHGGPPDRVEWARPSVRVLPLRAFAGDAEAGLPRLREHGVALQPDDEAVLPSARRGRAYDEEGDQAGGEGGGEECGPGAATEAGEHGLGSAAGGKRLANG